LVSQANMACCKSAKKHAEKAKAKAQNATTSKGRGEPTQFKTELCDCAHSGCCDAINVRTLFCPCLQWSYNHAILEGHLDYMPHCGVCCSGLPTVMSCPDVLFAMPQLEYYNRRRLRTIGNVVGEDPCSDFFLTVFCLPLVTCQNAREIQLRQKEITRDARKQISTESNTRSADLCDCMQGPASVNLRTMIFPCCQVALNRAVMEGDIDKMPDSFCDCLPQGVSICDALMGVVPMEYYTRRRIQRVRNFPAEDSLIALAAVVFCTPLVICQDAREIIHIQEDVVPTIKMAYGKNASGGKKSGRRDTSDSDSEA